LDSQKRQCSFLLVFKVLLRQNSFAHLQIVRVMCCSYTVTTDEPKGARPAWQISPQHCFFCWWFFAVIFCHLHTRTSQYTNYVFGS